MPVCNLLYSKHMSRNIAWSASLVVWLMVNGCGRLGYDVIANAVGDSSVPDGSATFDTSPIADGSIIDIEGSDYVVAPGFTIEAVLPPAQTEPQLANQGTALDFPVAGSGFAQAGYVGADVTAGNPATIYRVDEAAVQLVEIATAPVNAKHITQLSFAPAGGDYGDFLYVCVTSTAIAGDGIYRLAPGSDTLASWRLYDSCNGMAFDYENQLGDPGTSPTLYASRKTSDVQRMPPLATDPVETLQTLQIPHGLLLYVPQEQAFRGRMTFVAWNLQPSSREFFIWHSTSIDPWSTPVTFLPDVPSPRDVVFSEGPPFGDVMLVAMLATGEIVAYQDDGSSYVLVQGLDQPQALGWAEPYDELWVLERGRGRILRIRAQ